MTRRRQAIVGLGLAAVVALIGQARAEVIGSRPPGCPHAYCGCALARKLGLSDRALWLAREWFRFPRVHARAGAIAVRKHHVMQLRQHVNGTRWLVFDPNSGGHKTRLHVRDVRGFVFVDPTATASN